MYRLLIVAPLLAQAGDLPFGATHAPRIERTQDAARVPRYPNTSCPIMGKPISLALFTDTDHGRIWLCCKGCIAEVHADPALAYKTAYPTEQRVETERCIVTGKAFQKGSPEVVLQGRRFRVFDAAAAEIARREAQIVLARLMEPTLVDVANGVCPIDGKPVAPNAFVVIDGWIVRLSATKHASNAAEAPAKTLERALELARKSR
jgi:hypothetical protein